MSHSTHKKNQSAEPHRHAPTLLERFRQVRQFSETLCSPLEIEDHCLQSMAEASPPKWHLAHTSWFFETFLLQPLLAGYQVFNPQFRILFNSYYNSVGEQFPRPRRGLQSRPTVAEIYNYRHHVDQNMQRLLLDGDQNEVRSRTELGLQHEQQHQELLLTDLKHALSFNPIYPVYQQRPAATQPDLATSPKGWLDFDPGEIKIGASAQGFCFDNEQPAHMQHILGHQLGSKLVTCGEYLEFMLDGGYCQPLLWLSDGWATIIREQWQAPLYWQQLDGLWQEFTLAGLQPIAPDAPVAHISYYEADAFARWAEARLPTEFEWEHAVRQQPVELKTANLADSAHFHPRPAQGTQFFGDCWEWTQSPYSAYPGFKPVAGAIGEYNGKFMCNQMVLRGGSCVTSRDHIRPTYRNFFYPDARWQFSGIRLARDL